MFIERKPETSKILSVQEIPPEFQESFTVNIRGEKRLRKFTNPLEVPTSWYETGVELGKDLAEYFITVEEFLKAGGLKEIIGNETEVSKQMLNALSHPNAFSNFIPCADIAVSNDGNWSLLELNTRPASLGGAILLSKFFGNNRYITPDGQDIQNAITSHLEDEWGFSYAETSALISHPDNAFYSQHCILAEALKIPITFLQKLKDNDSGVYIDDKQIKFLIRQCSTAALFDNRICNPNLLDLWNNNFLDIKPGPLNVYSSEKFHLKLFPHQNLWLPQNQNIDQTENFSTRDYQGYWLKGRFDKSGEVTIFISDSMAKGSRANFLDNLVRKNYSEARRAALNIATSNDGKRFLQYLKECETAYSTQWVLQKDIDTLKVKIDGYPKEMRTVLRIHFVPSTNKDFPYLPFMQMYADNQVRVNASGFTIPLRFS